MTNTIELSFQDLLTETQNKFMALLVARWELNSLFKAYAEETEDDEEFERTYEKYKAASRLADLEDIAEEFLGFVKYVNQSRFPIPRYEDLVASEPNAENN